MGLKSGVFVLLCMHFFLGLNAQEVEWVVYNTSNSDLPHNQISREILVDQNNHKWIPTWGGGVVRISESQWTIYDTTNFLLTSTYNQIGHNIAYDEYRKFYWIPTWGGIAQFDEQNWTILNTQNFGLQNDIIGHLRLDHNYNAWFHLVGSGLGHYKVETDEWFLYNWSNGDIPQNHIRDIFIDNIGRVWIGFAGRGILIIDEEDWTFMDTTNTDIPSGHIRNIIQDKFDASMWITSVDGLMRFDGENWQVWDIDNSDVPQNWTTAIHQVHTGELWVGTWAEGICLFDGENWTVYNTSNSPLPSNHIRAVTQDHHGDIWIGTDNGVAVIKGLYDPIPQEEPEPEPEKELMVYPNPTDDELFIVFPDSTWVNSTIRVFNIQGQRIHKQIVVDLNHTLYLGRFSTGVYVVDMQNIEGVRKRRKVVVR